MENIFKNKIIIAIGLLASLITIFMFITGNQSLSSVLETDDSTQKITEIVPEQQDDELEDSNIETNRLYFYYIWNSQNWWKVLLFFIITVYAMVMLSRRYKEIGDTVFHLYAGIAFLVCFWSVLLAIISIFWK